MYCKLSYYFLLIFILFLARNPCQSIIHATKPQCLETERNALLEIKHNVQVLSFSWPLSWTGSNCCTWEHIICNNVTGNVIKLDLSNVLSYNKSLDGNVLLSLLSLGKLSYLDISGNNFSRSRIPKFFESFKSLEYLDVSYSFSGRIPDELGNLSNLQRLKIEDAGVLYIENIAWLSQLKSLRYLDLSGVNMSLSSDWLQALNSLPHIVDIDLFFCWLTSFPPLPQVNFTSVTTIDLSSNALNSSFPEWIYKLKNLRYFDAYETSLYGSLPTTLGNLSLLQFFEVSRNELSGQIQESIGQLRNLNVLRMSDNTLNGTITEAHFTNMSKLKHLDLSSNFLIFNTSDNWVPPFQLQELSLYSFQVGPKFPSWLRTQYSLELLQLYNAGIKGPIPNWFPNFSSKLQEIYLFNNDISGELSVFLNLNLTDLFLSNNSFSGPLPSEFGKKMTRLKSLVLSNNNFNGSIPSSFCEMKALSYLILPNNKLSEEFPDCWESSKELTSIVISSNNLSGTIPMSLCNLSNLQALQLNHNKLSGLIPTCIRNCTNLIELDLDHNNLIGNIPTWNENSVLSILSLSFNALTGRIPDLSQLQYLQILDLSNNYLSGHIPSSLGKLSAMTSINTLSIVYELYLSDLSTIAKGLELEFTWSVLSFLTLIDLSENNLTGDIPDELMKLYRIQTLNLSGNHLTGQIPTNIGKLQQLETLDLSRNNLSGDIPVGFEILHFLDDLNLSYNNLSGKIPTGDQLQTLNDPSIYEGNSHLCGFPLKMVCQSDENQYGGNDKDGVDKYNKSEEEFIWFYMAIAPGFVVGFWLVNGILILQPKWRIAYFQAIDRIYCKVAETIL